MDQSLEAALSVARQVGGLMMPSCGDPAEIRIAKLVFRLSLVAATAAVVTVVSSPTGGIGPR